MKKLLAPIIFVGTLLGADPRFAWEYPSGIEKLAGFRVYDATATATNITECSVVLTNTVCLDAGFHKLWVTAIGTNRLESAPSDSITVWVPDRPVRVMVLP